jgi:multiple sugar transport system permease protein
MLNILMNALGLPSSQWLLNESLTIPLIVVSMTWKGYGVTMLLYLSALQSVSQDLYEAAVIDGAGIWKRIFKITIPHVGPTMLLMWVQQLISVFQIFDQPLVMTDGGPNNASLTLGLTSYKMAFSYMQVDRSMALGTVSFFILLSATLFYFRMQKKLED